MNGTRSTVESEVYNIDIAEQTNYMLNLDDSGTAVNANMGTFFRETKYFEFSKSTSPDGKTMFFPRRNNIDESSTLFRKGDTTDYNTSYYYIDFVINNRTSSSKDVYFDADYDDIFTVSGDFTDETVGFTNYTAAQFESALRSAMRISITTQVGNSVEDTYIYSAESHSSSVRTYNSINPDPLSAPYDLDDLTAVVNTNAFGDYIYHVPEGSTVPDSTKLFAAKKNKETKVSIRIWFELMDPTFKAVFGYNSTSHTFTATNYSKVPGAVIGIDFALYCSENDYQALYFDDYTFSNVANKTHLTDEQDGYSVWFYAHQPATVNPTREDGCVALQLTVDSESAIRKRWYTGDATNSMMEAIIGTFEETENDETVTRDYVAEAYFAYANGDPSDAGSTVLYKWNLYDNATLGAQRPAADSSDYVYDAYSYTKTAVGTGFGAGIWDDSEANTMTLIKFSDRSTAVTNESYNAANTPSSVYNDKPINASAAAASNNVVYVNNTVPEEDNDDVSATYAPATAAMHYNSSDAVFESYVPTSWLTGRTGDDPVTAGCYFRSCLTTPYFAAANVTELFYGTTPIRNSGEYKYTALGYIGNSALTSSCCDGVGTWGPTEMISLSTELIDNDHKAAYRYYIGVTGYSSAALASDVNYYAMIPDAAHTTFHAYIPSAVSASSDDAIRFKRCGATGTDTANAYWYTHARHEFSTFYPVSVSTTETPTYTLGYWNLSVLVDGTYENLIYDTLTDGVVPAEDAANFGTLEYSYDNSSTWYTVASDSADTLTNNFDHYRWYAPAEDNTTVYWRWRPYRTQTGIDEDENPIYSYTEFVFEHDTLTGIYKLVTEAANGVVLSDLTPR